MLHASHGHDVRSTTRKCVTRPWLKTCLEISHTAWHGPGNRCLETVGVLIFPCVLAASHGRGGELLKTAAQGEGGGDRGSEEEAGMDGKCEEIYCTLSHSAKSVTTAERISKVFS